MDRELLVKFFSKRRYLELWNENKWKSIFGIVEELFNFILNEVIRDKVVKFLIVI